MSQSQHTHEIDNLSSRADPTTGVTGRRVKLGEICEIQLGKMLSPKSRTGLRPVPYLRNANVQWDRFDLSDVAQMDFDEREEAKFLLRPGDLLVCEGGEPGRAAVWDGQISRCCYQKALHRLRPINFLVDPHFLKYRLWLGAIRGEFVDSNAKTTIAHLPAVRLAELPLILPTLKEQHRIAANLTEQMTALGMARVAVHSQLDAACGLPGAYLRGIFDGAAANLWPSRSIADFAECCSGATPPRGNPAYYGGTIPWVKTGELRDTWIESTDELITEKALSETSLRLLPPLTVLVAMYGQGQTRGRTGLLRMSASTNQACFAMLPNDLFEPRYLQLWFQYSYEALREETEGRGGNQPNLNGALMKKLRVPFPPIGEQRLVCQEFEAGLASFEALENSLKERLDAIQRLRGALLSLAFSGLNP